MSERRSFEPTGGKVEVVENVFPPFRLNAAALLTVAGVVCRVHVRAEAVGPTVPFFLELSGNRTLLDAAGKSGQLRLDLLGLNFTTGVAAQNSETGRLAIEAKPLFLEMVKNLEARHYD